MGVTTPIWGRLRLLFRSMTMTTNNKIELNGAVLIQAKFTGCGGTAKISNGSIVVEGDTIDAEGYTSKNLQWFPLKALSFKDRFNKRVTRHLEKVGVDTPLGTVISEEVLAETLSLIDNCKASFNAEVENLCDEYEVIIEKHKIDAEIKSSGTRIGTIIDALKLPKQKFKDSFKVISMPPITLSVSSEEEADEIKSMLSDSALKTLVEDANHLFRKSYRGKEKVTKAATEATFALKDKFYNLSFASDGLVFVAEQFASLLDGLTVSEHDGATFHAMYRFVRELSDESGLLDIMTNQKEIDVSDQNSIDETVDNTATNTQSVNNTESDVSGSTGVNTTNQTQSSNNASESNPAETEQVAVKPLRVSGFGAF